MNRIPIGTFCLVTNATQRKECIGHVVEVSGHGITQNELMRWPSFASCVNPHRVIDCQKGFSNGDDGDWIIRGAYLMPITPDKTICEEENFAYLDT